MRVIFTGQSGINKDKIIENLASSILDDIGKSSSEDAKRILSLISIEKSFAQDPISFSKWIQMPAQSEQVETWERGVAKKIQSMKKESAANIFVCMHSVYHKHSRYFSPINWGLVRELAPDLFITLIDDVYDIWWRLRERQRNYSPSGLLRLREVMTWRSVEIMMTDQLARNLFPDKPIPHYVVAIKHPIQTLKRMILDPEAMRIYASYPITHTREYPDKRAEIDKHRAFLHNNFVTFDPVSIDEKLLSKTINQFERNSSLPEKINIDRTSRWPVPSNETNMPYLNDEVDYPPTIEDVDPNQIYEVTESDIDKQIVWRDYQLIDQAHCLAAFRPSFEGKMSGGMSAEITYTSRSSDVQVCQYVPKEDGPSQPFQQYGDVATTYEEFESLLFQLQSYVRMYHKMPSHYSQFES